MDRIVVFLLMLFHITALLLPIVSLAFSIFVLRETFIIEKRVKRAINEANTRHIP